MEKNYFYAMFAQTLGLILQVAILCLLVAYAFYAKPEWYALIAQSPDKIPVLTRGLFLLIITVLLLALWYNIQIHRKKVVKMGFTHLLAILMGIKLSISATEYGFDYVLYWFIGGFVMLIVAVYCGINAKTDLRPVLSALLFPIYALACIVLLVCNFYGITEPFELWGDIFWAAIAFAFAVLEVQDFKINVMQLEKAEDVDDLAHAMTINLFCDLLLFGAVFDSLRIVLKITTFRWLKLPSQNSEP